jgi:hypothetical protein
VQKPILADELQEPEGGPPGDSGFDES